MHDIFLFSFSILHPHRPASSQQPHNTTTTTTTPGPLGDVVMITGFKQSHFLIARPPHKHHNNDNWTLFDAVVTVCPSDLTSSSRGQLDHRVMQWSQLGKRSHFLITHPHCNNNRTSCDAMLTAMSRRSHILIARTTRSPDYAMHDLLHATRKSRLSPETWNDRS